MLLENMLFENATNDSNDFFKEKSKDYKIIKEDVRKYIYKIGRETTRVYGPDELGRHTSIIEIAKRRIGKKAKGEVIGFIDTSIFNTGSSGLLFTTRGIAFDYVFEKVFIRYDEITDLRYGDNKKELIISGNFHTASDYEVKIDDIYYDLSVLKKALKKLNYDAPFDRKTHFKEVEEDIKTLEKYYGDELKAIRIGDESKVVRAEKVKIPSETDDLQKKKKIKCSKETRKTIKKMLRDDPFVDDEVVIGTYLELEELWDDKKSRKYAKKDIKRIKEKYDI